MEVNNKLFFSLIKEAALQVGAEVISPPEAAALAAAAEASELGDGPPAALAVSEDEIDQFLVFLGCPRPFLHTKLVTTWLPSHHFCAGVFFFFFGYTKTLTTQQLPIDPKEKPHAPTFIYKRTKRLKLYY